MDIDALRTELLTGHPDTGAYDIDDRTAMDQINTVNRTRNRSMMTGSEVAQSIVQADFLALSEALQQRIWNVLHLGELNPFGIEADLFVSAFGGGSATITALQAARLESISRAVELGLGIVKLGHIEMART